MAGTAPDQPGGQPRYSDLAIELVLTLRLVLHLALRQAEAFTGTMLRLLGRDLAVLDHTTLSRRVRAFARQPRASRHDGHKLRAGTLLPWTWPPYGSRLDPDRPRDPAGVRLDEAEAAVVRDLFVWFANEEQSIHVLQQRLDQMGIISPRGHLPWSTSALHGVLTNPTYVGQVFANRVRARPAGQRRSALLPVGRSGMGATQAVNAAERIAVAPVPAVRLAPWTTWYGATCAR